LIAWDEISALTSSVTRFVHGGVVSQTLHAYIIERAHGPKQALSDHTEDVGEIGDVLEREVTRRLVPRFRQQLERAETVVFGPFTLTARGVQHKTKQLAWHDFAAVDLRGGMLRVFQHGQSSAWASVRFGALKNAGSLLALLEERAARRQVA
jgi:hypothetical protein